MELPKRTIPRHRAAGVCCVACLILICPGCSGKTSTSSTGKSKNLRPPALYRNAKKEVIAAEFLKSDVSSEQIAALSKHDELKEITFYECRGFGEDIYNELAKLSEVTEIHFVRSTIDDAGLAHMSNLPAAAHLTVSNSEITAAGISALKNWNNLKRLTLTGKINLDVLKGLSELNQLEHLEVAIDGFAPGKLIGHALPSLKVLSLPNAPLTDTELGLLPEWKTLELFKFPPENITDGGVAHFKKFSSLKELTLSNSKVTDAGLSELIHLENLEHLTLDGCEKVTNQGMKHIATFPVLKRLSLLGSGVTGAGLLNLVPSKRLRHVGIGEKKATKAEIAKAAEAMTDCKFDRVQQRPGAMD